MPRIGIGDNLIQKLAVLYIVVWSISPPLEIDMIYRIAALGCAGIWGIMSLRRGLYVYKIHIYAVLFALAVAFIAYMEHGSFDAILKHIAIYILVVCFVINAFYEDGNKWSELSGIIPIVLILLIVFNWKTADILLEDHTIARALVRNDEEVYQYLRQGIGGYSLIYPQVIVSPAILAWVVKAFRNNKLYFAIGCVWIVTYVLCIMRAGYSIAIFASIIGAILVLLYRGKHVLSAVLLAFIIFASALALIYFSSGVRGFLLETFDGTAVATKINDFMGTSADGGEAGESIQDRIAMYQSSIEKIIKYPFIGALWMGSGGGHSAILDIFAKYGLWGGFIFVTMIFFVPRYYRNKFKSNVVTRIANATTVTIMFVGMLDSFTYSFMPMILIVLPIIFEDILKWEGKKNENSMGGELDSRRIV